MVEPRKLHEIWIEQCEAARTIKDCYGLKAAFNYLVGEKLLNFTEAASEHRAFAQELPRFVSEVRRMFTAGEIGRTCADRTRSQRKRCRPGAGRRPSCGEPDSEGGAGSAVRDDQGPVDGARSWHVLADSNSRTLSRGCSCARNVIQLRPYAHAQLNRWISLFVIVTDGPTNGARLLMCDAAANPRTRK